MKEKIRLVLIGFMVVGIIVGPASYFKTRADIEASKINFDKTNSTQYGATKGNVQEAMDVVYFNPVSNTKCTSSDYSTSNSATNYKG